MPRRGPGRAVVHSPLAPAPPCGWAPMREGQSCNRPLAPPSPTPQGASDGGTRRPGLAGRTAGGSGSGAGTASGAGGCAPEIPVGPGGVDQVVLRRLPGWLEAVGGLAGLRPSSLRCRTPRLRAWYAVRRHAAPTPRPRKARLFSPPRSRRRRVALLGPDLEGALACRCRRCARRAAMTSRRPARAEVEQVLGRRGMEAAPGAGPAHDPPRTAQRDGWVGAGFYVSQQMPHSGSSWGRATCQATCSDPLGAHAAQYLCSLLAWWLLGQGALQGRFDPAWLVAWGLLVIDA